ncbi:hypothetical protein, partial [Pseudomonas yangonensis]|uniref:hypothetical protein n=1 Tax=Pseudomonas yangonensis TaxID=2579922 RepID=UPI001C498915
RLGPVVRMPGLPWVWLNTPYSELQNPSGSGGFALSKQQIFVNLHQSILNRSSDKSFYFNCLRIPVCL